MVVLTRMFHLAVALACSALSPLICGSIKLQGHHHADEAALLSDAESAATKMSLYCFAWTPRRKYDEAMMPESRQQLSKCDDHAYFTDENAPVYGTTPEIDFVKVHVPPQTDGPQQWARGDKGWLMHKNMAGLIPTWTHLLERGIAEKHDWVINTELDHFVRPSKVRLAIARYLQVLRNGTLEERESVGKPMVLVFGNAFVFNRPMIEEMRRQWPSISKTKPDGCSSVFTRCEQDIHYLQMAARLNASIYGASMCGQPFQTKAGTSFPLACWDMKQSPGITDKQDAKEVVQLNSIREIANQVSSAAKQTAVTAPPVMLARKRERLSRRWATGATTGVLWNHFVPDALVPIIHHIRFPQVHVLARELLGL